MLRASGASGASVVLAAGLVVLAAGPAGAVVPRTGHRITADVLTAMPAAKLTKPLRNQRQLRWSQAPSAAWQRFATAAGGTWSAAWDQATAVPIRIWGSGIPAPGAIASAAVAEQVARQLLADHIALLAPGSVASDFELVSNQLDVDMRVVGFVQRSRGTRVIGGQVSFRFKHDRMFMIGSEALPDVAVPPTPYVKLARATLHARATTALRIGLDLPRAPVGPLEDDVILPLIGDDAVLGYRVATPVTIDGGIDGRYQAYADPTTGEVLAVHQLNEFASGTVLYHGLDQNTLRPRVDRPAPLAHVLVDGAPETTAADGTLSWADPGAQTIQTAVVGDLASIVNMGATGVLALAQMTLAPNGQIVWDASATAEDDAQVNAYLDINIVKNFVAAHVDSNMPTLFDPITVNVNIAQDCNAFFDGKAVNFFHATMKCQNTALVQDVLFHEFGHDVHSSEIIMGVGAFDGAMSEGAADTLAVNMTNDHGMGRGFFYTEDALRDLDPVGSEATWPRDIGEIHTTGLIFGGTFWDLRKALIAEYGMTDGVALTLKLYLGALRRSVDIPTSLLEVLATDDDDGDLSNGTPHECEIRGAFGRHGLRTATGAVTAPATLSNAASTIVRLDLSGLSERCHADEIDHVTLEWRPIGASPEAGSALATQVSTSRYWAQLPLASNGTVLYKYLVTFTDGSVLTLADNLADPYYELYQGDVIPLYCTKFEDGDPLQAGWTTGTDDGSPSPWSWGVPTGGATDPHAAFSGSHILSLALDGDYAAKSYSYVHMPPIDVGQWSDVRLQYRRWLSVEDSHFDQARVLVNDRQVWVNFTANMGDASSTAHVDREWRFQDLPLSAFAHGHVVTAGWDLRADEGLEYGGWALDDVCIVANVHSVCGDGITQPTETCDDGPLNADAPNACRTYCQVPACGDGIVDDNEECDAGPTGSVLCTTACKVVPQPTLGGCCSSSRGGGGSAVLGAVVAVFVLRRRKRLSSAG